MIPDIKGMAQIVYEPGRLYPHHNLYYIVSDTWNLRALHAVLRAGIAQLFVSTYAPRMRGGSCASKHNIFGASEFHTGAMCQPYSKPHWLPLGNAEIYRHVSRRWLNCMD